MGRQALSKTTKIRNLFNTGADVTWKTLRNKFDLKSPAAIKRSSLQVSTKCSVSKSLTTHNSTYRC